MARSMRTAAVTAIAAACALAGLGAGGQAAAPGPERGTLRTGTTGNDSELVKTIPIGKRTGDKRRVVMSLQPGNLGELRAGDRLEATAEVEVSVCLKPNELHGSDRPCVGRTYGYDPAVSAELVLADGAKTGGASTVPLGADRLTCNQSQPNRNHHCVLVIDDGLIEIEDANLLPCKPQTCHINLVLSASDRNARAGDRLVVGADSGGKSVNGDKGRVNFARFRPGGQKDEQPLISEARLRPILPIVGEGAKVNEQAVYSVELGNLRLGEQLVIEGRLVTRIGGHPYNAFQTTGIVLSENPRSASREGWPERVGDLNGQIAEANGFNCTQGDSAHESPCVARKVGVLEITRDSPKTLYVNLVAGMAAQADFEDRHKDGDVAQVLREGFLRVYRYPADRNDSPPPARD